MDKHDIPPTIISTISLPEIKKIYEDRLIWDTIDGSKNNISEHWYTIHRSKKRQKLSSADKIDKTPPSDLISRLPDDALCSILSNLSARESVRTSILSKRWRHLWRTTPLKNLCFDVTSMTRNTSKFEKEFDNVAFVKFVNRISAQHCGTTIESFRVERSLRPIDKYIQDIDKWIEFAANKNVRKLDISLSTNLWEEMDYYETTFPYWLLNNQGRRKALRHLTLTLFPLHLPPRLGHLRFLISLTLKCVYIPQANLTNILTSCLSLQWLSMTRCCYSRKLKFSGGSKLKHLNISMFYHLEEIDIRDLDNLMSFEFSGPPFIEIYCNKTAPITRVCCNGLSTHAIEWFDAKRKFKQKFPQLETLLLSAPPLKVRNVPYLPIFTKLKHLVFIIRCQSLAEGSFLEPIASFLEASPYLQTFELHFPERVFPKNRITNNKREIFRDSYRQYNLKEVKMYNFYGEIVEVELVEYLVNNFVSLETIQIDRKRLEYKGDGEWALASFQSPNIKRKAALKMLRKIIPKSTNLIIL